MWWWWIKQQSKKKRSGNFGGKEQWKKYSTRPTNKSVYFLFFLLFFVAYWWNIFFLFSNIDDIYQISNEIKQNISPICIKIIELNRCWRFDDDNDDDTGRYVNKKQVKGKKVQVYCLFVWFVSHHLNKIQNEFSNGIFSFVCLLLFKFDQIFKSLHIK